MSTIFAISSDGSNAIAMLRSWRPHAVFSRRVKLGAKLGLVVLVCMIGTMIFAASFLLHKAQIEADFKARSLATEATDRMVEHIRSDFERSLRIVTITNANLVALWGSHVRDRHVDDVLLKQMLADDPSRFGAWVVWKTNAFDDRDKDFVDAPNSDATGRYLSYWHQNGMEIALDKVRNYEDPTAALYRLPLDKGKAFLSEPYFIQGNDRRVPTVSYSEPIIADDNTLGAIGMDVSLSPLDDSIAALPLPPDAKIALLSHGGTVVGSSDRRMVDQPIAKIRPDLSAVFRRVVGGGPAEATIDTPFGPVIQSWHPIAFDSSMRPWYVMVELPIRAYATNAQRQQQPAILVALGVIVFVMAAILLAVRAIVTRPLEAIEGYIATLRDENETRDCPEMRRADEIGSIAKTLVAFKSSELEVERLKRSERAREDHFASARQMELTLLADQLAQSVQHVARSVEETSTKIMRRAETLAATAVASADRTCFIANESAAADRSVGAVDQAASALRQSIAGIALEMSHARRIASEAADEATTSSVVTTELSRSASRIGEIVAMIGSIASRTNMLALNASIEAARAGDSGRGFAVVAQEVKALATQTSEATSEIAQQIASMQGTAQEAAETLIRIGGRVAEINDISATIGDAVTAQGEQTKRITRSLDEAISASQRVSAAIVDVDRATSQTGDAAADMLIESTKLADESARLNDEVLDFITKIRAA